MTSTTPTISRVWCMPSPDTFTMPPVATLLDRWLDGCNVIVDPFARNSRRGTITNDLNPETAAQEHLPAEVFCRSLIERGVEADAVLYDPPYSPRQVAECYQSAGLAVSQCETQTARMNAEAKDALARVLRVGGVAASFGWNTTGFGKRRGFILEEILLVNHGASHNDTICVVERKVQAGLFDTEAA